MQIFEAMRIEFPFLSFIFQLSFPPLLKELYVEKQMPEVEFELPISTDHTIQRIVNTR